MNISKYVCKQKIFGLTVIFSEKWIELFYGYTLGEMAECTVSFRTIGTNPLPVNVRTELYIVYCTMYTAHYTL